MSVFLLTHGFWAIAVSRTRWGLPKGHNEQVECERLTNASKLSIPLRDQLGSKTFFGGGGGGSLRSCLWHQNICGSAEHKYVVMLKNISESIRRSGGLLLEKWHNLQRLCCIQVLLRRSYFKLFFCTCWPVGQWCDAHCIILNIYLFLNYSYKKIQFKHTITCLEYKSYMIQKFFSLKLILSWSHGLVGSTQAYSAIVLRANWFRACGPIFIIPLSFIQISPLTTEWLNSE